MSAPAQLTLDLGHRVALGREDFLVAPSNADAVGWIDRWHDWPGPCLVLCGPEGSGKTHLAHVWRANTDAVEIAGKTMNSSVALAPIAGGGRCVLVDGGEEVDDDRALLHLFNAVGESGGHLLLTARRPPSRWEGRLPDLMSRLRSAPTVALTPPDDTLMAALLIKQFADRQMPVDVDIVPYLLTRIERSSGAARRIVAEIDRTALAQKRKVSLTLVKEILRRDSA